MTDDIKQRLREGTAQRTRRWSGDTHSDLGGTCDEEATEKVMAEAAAHIEMLEQALGYISRMTACPDKFINVVTLNTAIQIAKNALAGKPLGPMP